MGGIAEALAWELLGNDKPYETDGADVIIRAPLRHIEQVILATQKTSDMARALGKSFEAE